MKKYSTKESVTLLSFHLPVLLVLLAVALVGFGTIAKAVSRNTVQTVLSEDDERDSENDSNDEGDDGESDDGDDRDSENGDEDEDDTEADREDSDDEDENDSDVDEDIEDDDRDEDGHEVEFKYESNDNSVPELSNLLEAELEQEIESNGELGATVDKVELEVKTVNGEYEYEGATFKDGKLFGIFDVSIPMGIEINPDTGQIISVNQTFWSKLLDFLSF